MPPIVSLHAHPDDEALLTGGWPAQRATDGDAGLTARTRLDHHPRLHHCPRQRRTSSVA